MGSSDNEEREQSPLREGNLHVTNPTDFMTVFKRKMDDVLNNIIIEFIDKGVAHVESMLSVCLRKLFGEDNDDEDKSKNATSKKFNKKMALVALSLYGTSTVSNMYTSLINVSSLKAQIKEKNRQLDEIADDTNQTQEEQQNKFQEAQREIRALKRALNREQAQFQSLNSEFLQRWEEKIADMDKIRIESVEQTNDYQRLIRDQMEAKDEISRENSKLVKEKNEMVEEINRIINEKNGMVEDNNRTVKEKNEEINRILKEKNEEINRILKEKNELVEEKNRITKEKDKVITDLTQKLVTAMESNTANVSDRIQTRVSSEKRKADQEKSREELKRLRTEDSGRSAADHDSER